jgi:flagellar protein FlaG
MVSVTNVQTPTHIYNATSASISVDALKSAKPELKMVAQTDKSQEEVNIPSLVNELNKISEEEPLSVSFGYDEELGKVYINVTDKNSGEVIRKLPSEEAMKFAKSIKETVGKLLDKRG